MLFSLREGEFAGWRMLSVVGEIDLASLPTFQQRVRAVSRGPEDVAVNLDGCDFIDSAGLGILVGAARRARDGGHRFAIVAAEERIRSLLERSRLDEIIEVVPDTEALSEVPIAGGAS